jgi:predicted RNA-binding Zn ribbon-like protein
MSPGSGAVGREPAGRPFLFVGERLCADFVNTELVEGGARVNLLPGFAELVAWYTEAQVLTAAEARDMMRRWRGSPEAGQAHHRALELRGTLRAMLERLASGRRDVPAQTLDAINELLRLSTDEPEIARTSAGYEMRVRRAIDRPEQLLVAVARSAAHVLSADDLRLVRKCQNPECVLVFYDTTKNHARRWCSMAACGNRAKVAAHYRRARG